MFHILKSILRQSVILIQYFFQPDDDAVEFNERYLNGELQLMFDDLNSDISYAEIFKACRELSIGKSGGSDFVSNMVLMKWQITYANYLMLSFKKDIFQLNGRKVLLSRYIKREI